jgi:hypothetical protein
MLLPLKIYGRRNLHVGITVRAAALSFRHLLCEVIFSLFRIQIPRLGVIMLPACLTWPLLSLVQMRIAPVGSDHGRLVLNVVPDREETPYMCIQVKSEIWQLWVRWYF